MPMRVRTAVRNKASSMMGEAQWSGSVGDAFRTVKEALEKIATH